MFLWVWTQLEAIFLKDLGQIGVGGGGGLFSYINNFKNATLNFSVYKNISSQE